MTPPEYLQREDNDKEALKQWLEEIKQFAINAKAREFMVMLDAILRMKARDMQAVFLVTQQSKEEHVAYLSGMRVTTDIIKDVLKEKKEKDDA